MPKMLDGTRVEFTGIWAICKARLPAADLWPESRAQHVQLPSSTDV